MNEGFDPEGCLFAAAGFTLQENQDAVRILVDDFAQPLDERGKRDSIQPAFKHAFLNPEAVILQRFGCPISLAIFHNVVADDIVSLLRHEAFVRK